MNDILSSPEYQTKMNEHIHVRDFYHIKTIV